MKVKPTDLNGTLPLTQGGTGATSASAARTALGLGSIATQASSAVSVTGGSITGITDLAVADGGTGASTLTGYLKGNGTSAFTASSTVPVADIAFGSLTSYTPTITSGSGTITTKSATGAYYKVGKLVFVTITIQITTNGTGAGWVIATLPSTSAAFYNIITGREVSVTGNMLTGTIATSTNTMTIQTYANAYPGGNGYGLVMSGWYVEA